MARTTPQVREATLTQPVDDAAPIAVGTTAWYAWLEEATTFAFADAHGSFTARKEPSGRSGCYWKAYRMQGGKLRRAYLGKSCDLTLERLQAAALDLSQRESPSGHPASRRAPNQKPKVHADTSDSQVAIGFFAPGASLLASKLSVPPVRPDLVQRPQLIERLDTAAQGKLTLLSAPPGFGKTTLLTAWLNRERLEARDWRLAESSLASSPQPLAPRVAWASLDTGDNDPVQFWSYVLGALDRAHHGFGSTPFSALQAAERSMGSVLTALLNALGVLEAETLLVLDDYHVIDTPSIHEGMQVLIEHLPQRLHLVIASRCDPPFPLSSLRARPAERTARRRFAVQPG